MNAMTRWIALALTGALLAATPAPGGSGVSDAAAALDAIAERYWQRELRFDYSLREQVGLPVETIRPITFENAQEDARFGESVLDALAAVDEQQLDHDHWLTFRTLKYLAHGQAASAKYYWLAQQATPYAGGSQIGTLVATFASFRFESADDAKRYESLLEQYAAFVASLRELLIGQHARGVVLPQVEIDATQAVYQGYAQPAQSDALVPAESRLQGLAPADRTALRETASRTVARRLCRRSRRSRSTFEVPIEPARRKASGFPNIPAAPTTTAIS